jgi:hypothetical protein
MPVEIGGGDKRTELEDALIKLKETRLVRISLEVLDPPTPSGLAQPNSHRGPPGEKVAHGGRLRMSPVNPGVPPFSRLEAIRERSTARLDSGSAFEATHAEHRTL